MRTLRAAGPSPPLLPLRPRLSGYHATTPGLIAHAALDGPHLVDHGGDVQLGAAYPPEKLPRLLHVRRRRVMTARVPRGSRFVVGAGRRAVIVARAGGRTGGGGRRGHLPTLCKPQVTAAVSRKGRGFEEIQYQSACRNATCRIMITGGGGPVRTARASQPKQRSALCLCACRPTARE